MIQSRLSNDVKSISSVAGGEMNISMEPVAADKASLTPNMSLTQSQEPANSNRNFADVIKLRELGKTGGSRSE